MSKTLRLKADGDTGEVKVRLYGDTSSGMAWCHITNVDAGDEVTLTIQGADVVEP